MRKQLSFSLLTLGLLFVVQQVYCQVVKHQEANRQADDQLSQLQRCRDYSSPLERLDCYDNAWGDKQKKQTAVQETVKPEERGTVWQLAMTQEQQRQDHSSHFLLEVSETTPANVVLTTPALGTASPRPILMLSCIDNITRMQIILLQSVKGHLGEIGLKTDKHKFTSYWFIRDNGYVIEANRGLPGIEEIKQLFGSRQLVIQSKNRVVNNLTFNIEHLQERIKPLRTACHW